VHGDVASVPSLVSREAYRIVQEGLTNALKYAGDGTARLDVTRTDAELTVTVVNPRSGEQAPGSGRGLRGVAERVQALGGSFSAAAADDTWVLAASLPLARSDR
jgi:signal transduction histidine kinase